MNETAARSKATKSGAAPAAGEIAEQGAAQAREALEKANAAAAEAAELMKNSLSMAAKGVQEYNNKVFEFAQANSHAAFEFYQKLLGVKSPSELMALSTEHASKQFEIMKEQTKVLTSLAQKVAIETTEPLKNGAARALSNIRWPR